MCILTYIYFNKLIVSWDSFYFWSIGAHAKSGKQYFWYAHPKKTYETCSSTFFIMKLYGNFRPEVCFFYHYLQCLYCLWNECWLIHCANNSHFCEKAHFLKCESAFLLNVSNAKQWLSILPVGVYLKCVWDGFTTWACASWNKTI